MDDWTLHAHAAPDEIVGELVLAIKLGAPLQTLADVIHTFPAFNRMLGESLNQLAGNSCEQRRSS